MASERVIADTTLPERQLVRCPPQPTQPPRMGGEEVLYHRATLLYNLKDDPRFLRFLPVVFPVPPFTHHRSQAEDSAIASAFYMRQLVMMYPEYSERGELVSPTILAFSCILNTVADVWYHICPNAEGILPFIPHITEDGYDPRNLSRRLSPDILSVR